MEINKEEKRLLLEWLSEIGVRAKAIIHSFPMPEGDRNNLRNKKSKIDILIKRINEDVSDLI